MGDIGASISTRMAEKFFATRGHGVLSLANDDDAYGVPVSYGYDPATERCIIHLVVEPSSKKVQFLETADTVTLTAYEYDADAAWQSVIATGSLVELSSDDVAEQAAAIFFTRAAYTDVTARRESDPADVHWYELEIETLTGRGTE
ncbi:pyridoxamine 5'-phosphate oxidase family protein [Natronolimnohabitans sp. A-GB9]|uniref:pyridoxamine 5'-phosphate oxidase family protein n=1 Tax=Natronolimnohabitans sp. A-GB9 TaxID=3069757 RepID=UPI0027B65DC2|nr:pyridoxamine 5'-phosphate oxidase family protein [Natronolimnohabitans sp. A-GB9]MDQ2052620.1 pyridoxamine 5'-phosphate oxidase family protein [Natronolimnohabitans sp. A-GB9]